MSVIEWSQRSAVGLRRYVALVVESVGADMDAASVTYDLPPACAYIALNARLAHFPARTGTAHATPVLGFWRERYRDRFFVCGDGSRWAGRGNRVAG